MHVDSDEQYQNSHAFITDCCQGAILVLVRTSIRVRVGMPDADRTSIRVRVRVSA